MPDAKTGLLITDDHVPVCEAMCVAFERHADMEVMANFGGEGKCGLMGM